MTARAKSINLFFVDGTPKGLITERCIFLFGTSDESGENIVYIDQAGMRKNGEYSLSLCRSISKIRIKTTEQKQ